MRMTITLTPWVKTTIIQEHHAEIQRLTLAKDIDSAKRAMTKLSRFLKKTEAVKDHTTTYSNVGEVSPRS
jgi:hypothetical protein